ncbi:MAG: serine protein kinase PrkA, partial [Desulfobacterales bacterium]|nr:serine protein kinase PrkA [Desulfobacterales bacterium]
NLLRRLEEYSNTEEGARYETVWRLDPQLLGGSSKTETILVEKLSELLNAPGRLEAARVNESDRRGVDNGLRSPPKEPSSLLYTDDFVEVACPSHDHPLLMIPKPLRRPFLDDLLGNNEFKWRLYTQKEYEWVFRETPCTICSAVYEALIEILKTPLAVFKMLHTRPYRFNRRLGEGVSVFNPGDKPTRQNVMSNQSLQAQINALFRNRVRVPYLFSKFARTNNGIYALMDIKSHNTERLMELHNIISEGVHKVEQIEEGVNSLFLAVMNPEDKKNIKNVQSFTDRIDYIRIPYVLDLNTEVKIYRNIFGRHIDEHFLPKVLHNFARVIISSRLQIKSQALLEWIGDPKKYSLYCDKNLQLLKMEIYTGYIPPWLSEEDRKEFTAKRRRQVIDESLREGEKGFSGRDSIKIFNEFYTTFAKDDKLINMSMLVRFFTKNRQDLGAVIPDGFLESLTHLYDYTVLHQVKECLYYYNEEQISRDIQNYMFAINFEPGTVETCQYTGEKLDITDAWFESIENRLLGKRVDAKQRLEFRGDSQKDYTSHALTQEILLEGKPIVETELYQDLMERYVRNLKEKVLEPFLKNENFRQGIKDYGKETFKTYDKRIREDVTFLMDNLGSKYKYSPRGAQEVCMYVVDSELAEKFADA